MPADIKKPRILVLTDLEGVSGIGSMEEIDRTRAEYKEACRKLMLDTNAAVEGAFSGGASSVQDRPRHSCRNA